MRSWVKRTVASVALLAATCSAEFWRDLQFGEQTTFRVEPGLAYCEALDVMLMVGGSTYDGSLTKTLSLYSFEKMTTTTTNFMGPARMGWSLVSLSAHPSLPDVCRFAITGGIDDNSQSNTRPVWITSTEVWIIQVQRGATPGTFEIAQSLVQGSNDSTSSGRYQAGSVGYKNSMFIFGGVNRRGSTYYYYNNIMGFTLSNPTGNLTDINLVKYSGRWSVVSKLDTSSRVRMGTAALQDNWIISGGAEAVSSKGSIQLVPNPSVVGYNLTELVALTAYAGGKSTFKRYDEYGGRDAFRYDHVTGMLGNTLFTYGGGKMVKGTDPTEVGFTDANYVSITNFDPESQMLSCKTKTGERVSWCAFSTEFPGTAEKVTGVQRKDTLIAYVVTRRGVSVFHELNMTSVVRSGNSTFEDAVALDVDEAGQFGTVAFKALQYTLIAVCIFLILVIGVLFRQRNYQEIRFIEAPVKNRGVSVDIIRGLDFVTYDTKGNHVPVKVKYNDDGEPEIVETLPKFVEDEEEIEPSAGNNRASRRPSDVVKLGDGEILEMEEQQRPQGMSEVTDTDLCPICLLDFEQGELLQKLPCGHLFHADCVEPWLLKNATCPQDRIHIVNRTVQLETNNEDEEGAESEASRDSAESSDGESHPSDERNQAPRLTNERGEESGNRPNDLSLQENHESQGNQQEQPNTENRGMFHSVWTGISTNVGHMWNSARARVLQSPRSQPEPTRDLEEGTAGTRQGSARGRQMSV